MVCPETLLVNFVKYQFMTVASSYEYFLEKRHFQQKNVDKGTTLTLFFDWAKEGRYIGFAM